LIKIELKEYHISYEAFQINGAGMADISEN
jgi:hypothetical protein